MSGYVVKWESVTEGSLLNNLFIDTVARQCWVSLPGLSQENRMLFICGRVRYRLYTALDVMRTDE